MSLTKDAMQYLGSISKIGDTVKEADFPAIILTTDSAIQSLEDLQQYRNRFTGNFNTASINDFARYVKKHRDENTQCFIENENPTATSIFNLGNINEPGHADYKATVHLQKTTEYEALQKINNTHMSQKQLAEFIEDWTTNITIIDTNGNDMENKKAVSVIRSMTIEQATKIESDAQQFSENMTASQKIEARAKDGGPQAAWITFICKPYDDLKNRDFAMRVSVITGDNIKLSLKVAKLEKIKSEIIDEFKEIINNKLNDTDIYIGTFEF